jgi:predicted amidohydrolase
MTRLVKVQVVQPVMGPGGVEQGLRMLAEAGKEKADVVLLPECFNMIDFALADWPQHAEAPGGPVETRVRALAAQYHMYVVLPLARKVEGAHVNEAIIVDRRGEVVGKYTKTHLARAIDADIMHAALGDELPVFDLDFGRVGIMICYDNNFPWVAATLAVKGAEIIFYPHLQGGPSELIWEAQTRARAVDHLLYVASCCVGVKHGSFWRPGFLYGRSSIVGPDGLFLCDAGRFEGRTGAEIDLDWPQLMDITHEGDVRDLRRLIREDRRLSLYGCAALEGG